MWEAVLPSPPPVLIPSILSPQVNLRQLSSPLVSLSSLSSLTQPLPPQLPLIGYGPRVLDCLNHLTPSSPPPPTQRPRTSFVPASSPSHLTFVSDFSARFGVSKVSSIPYSGYATFIVHNSNAQTLQWAIPFPCLGVQRTASTNCTTNQCAASWTSAFSTTTTTSGDVAYQCFNHISGVHHLDDSNLDLISATSPSH